MPDETPVIGPLAVAPAAAVPLLRARCSALARQYGVPAAQLAIHADGETVTVEVGELEPGRRTTAATAFPIGSITKSYTATLAMVLVADGDLDLDAPIGEYLPEVGDGLGDEVTLRQLLSHTSGFAAGPDSDDVATASVRRYATDHCRRRDLVLAPGSGFSYSNAGYVLVGGIIEAVTGMPWREAMESIVLRPLGIEPAFVIGPAGSRCVATGHSVHRSARRGRPVLQTLADVEAPAGALATSATDLVRLALTTLLPPAHRDEMRRPVQAAEPFGLADAWGLGLAIYHDGVHWVGHDGNGQGTACHLRIDPVGERVIAFTSNSNTGAAMWQELCDLLRRLGFPLGSSAEPIADRPRVPAPRGCSGVFANGTVEFVVDARDGRALLAVDDEPPLRMTFHDDLVFSVPDPESHQPVLGGRFVRDPRTAQLDGLQIGGRLARRTRTVRDTRPSLIA